MMKPVDHHTLAAYLHQARADAVANEREHLGELLHDGVFQTLNAAFLDLARLRLTLQAAAVRSEGAAAAVFASEPLRISDALERQMRLAAGDLRGWLRGDRTRLPDAFTQARQADGDLAGALRWLILKRLRFTLAEPSRTRCGARDRRSPLPGQPGPADGVPCVHLVLRGRRPVILAPAVEVEVLAIVQEALLNADRHGHARAVWLTVDAAPRPKIVVRDNGSRRPGAFASEGVPTGQGFGLQAMRVRAARLGAHLRVVAAWPHGTRVSLRLPRSEISAAPAPRAGRPTWSRVTEPCH